MTGLPATEKGPVPARLGRYEILARIGAGGMAEVFLARSPGAEGIAKRLVVKRILPSYAGNAKFIDMFVTEAELAMRLNHPNVVQVYGFEEQGGELLLAMEHVDGTDLATLMSDLYNKTDRLPFGLSAFIVCETARGLHYAHNRKDERGISLDIIHRDVSPQNILLTFEGGVKLTDFGIATGRDDQEEPGAIKGKIAYMSPEQARGEALGQQSDVYSLGIVLAELLMGRKMYPGLQGAELIDRVKRADRTLPRSIDPTVPETLNEIVREATAESPEQRMPTARALAQRLSDFLHGETQLFDATMLEQYLEGIFPGRQVTRTEDRTWVALSEAPASPDIGPSDPIPDLGSSAPIEVPLAHDPTVPVDHKESVQVFVLHLRLVTQGAEGARTPSKDMQLVWPKQVLGTLRSLAFKHAAVLQECPPDVEATGEAEEPCEANGARPSRDLQLLIGLGQPTEYDSLHALRLAMEIRESMEGMALDASAPLYAAIGIARATASTTRAESGRLLDHHVVTKERSLAKQLGTLAQPGQIVVSGEVYLLTRRAFAYRLRDSLPPLPQGHAVSEAPPVLDTPPQASPPQRETTDTAPPLPPPRAYLLEGWLTSSRLISDARDALAGTGLLGREEEVANILAAYQVSREQRRPEGFLVLGSLGIGKTALVAEACARFEAAPLVLIAEANLGTADTPMAVIAELVRAGLQLVADAEGDALVGARARTSLAKKKGGARRAAGGELGVQAEESPTSRLRQLFGLDGSGIEVQNQGAKEDPPRLAERPGLPEKGAGLREDEPTETDRRRCFAVLEPFLVQGSPTASKRDAAAPGSRSRLSEDPWRDAFDAFCMYLRLLRSRQPDGVPLVLWVDALQWADVTSRDLLLRLLSVRRVPLLLLLSGRASPSLRDVRRIVPHLELRPLSDDSTERLIRDCFDGADVDERVRSTLQSLALGNPFFVRELTEAMLARGAVKVRGGKKGSLPLIAPGDAPMVLPRTLEGLLASRLGELPEPQRRILRWLAIAGDGLEVHDLRRLTGRDVMRDLRALQALRWVVYRARVGYLLASAVGRQVVYETTDIGDRQRMHARVARDGLQRTPMVAPGRAARHFEHAGELALAAASYVRAAEQARSSYSNRNALRFYAKALELVEGDAPERFAIHEGRAQILRGLGQRDQESIELHAMLRLAKARKENAWEAQSLNRLARHALDGGQTDGVQRTLSRARRAAIKAGDLGAEVEARKLEARWAQRMGLASEASAHCREALARVEGVPTMMAARGSLLLQLSELEQRRGGLDRAHAAAVDATAVFHRLAIRRNESQAMHTLGITLALRGRVADAKAVLEHSVRIDREIGDRFHIPAKLYTLASVHQQEGKPETARAFGMRAFDMLAHTGTSECRLNVLVLLAELAWHAAGHDMEDAMRELEDGMAVATGEHSAGQVRAWMLRARIEEADRAYPRALRAAAKAVEGSFARQDRLLLAKAHVLLARISEACNRRAEAEHHARAAETELAAIDASWVEKKSQESACFEVLRRLGLAPRLPDAAEKAHVSMDHGIT